MLTEDDYGGRNYNNNSNNKDNQQRRQNNVEKIRLFEEFRYLREKTLQFFLSYFFFNISVLFALKEKSKRRCVVERVASR